MLKQLNETVNYIEKHLLDEQVIEKAMKNISVSDLHFKNVFFFLAGMSLNEYVCKLLVFCPVCTSIVAVLRWVW